MFPSLCSLLGDGVSCVEGKMFLVSEDSSDASFVLHHLMSQHLKNGKKVCLVSTTQSYSHHASIHAKLGSNLDKLKANGNLIFVDAVKLYCEDCLRDDSSSCDSASPDLTKLFREIQNELKEADSTLLIIEDVSVFLSLGSSVETVYEFIMWCKSLTIPEIHSRGSLAVLMHKGYKMYEDDDACDLYNIAVYSSDVIVDVNVLDTGYFKDVDGQIEVKKRSRRGIASSEKMHFKLEEKSVKVFARGTCNAVL